MARNLTKSPLFNVILFSIFWTLQIFTSKLGYATGAKLVAFAIQSFASTLIFLTISILPKISKELKNIPAKILLGLILANGIHMGIGGVLSYAGIALTSAINAGVLVQFGTVTTTLLAWLILKEKFTLAKTISIVAILSGIFLLATKGKFITPHIGDLLILGACAAWSLGNVLVKKILKYTSVSADVISFFRPVAGLPVLLVFILLAPLYPLPIKQIFLVNYFDFHYIIFSMLSGIFTGLYFIYMNRTLKFTSASYVAMMSALTPVLVSLLAVFLLKESFSLIQLLGIILIIAAGMITHYLKTDQH